jgi:predicted nucleotidyltransferase
MQRESASVLFGKTRGRVLGWLLGHPDEAFYFRQIVRNTGAAQGAVQRELATLTRAGLLRRTPQGRHVYFQANRESPVFPELQGLFLKTVGLADVLKEGLEPFSDEIHLALIFGSAARGELMRDSDIDLLLVGEVSFSTVAHALKAAEDRLGREVNFMVYPFSEFKAKVRNRHHFLTTVLSEPRLFIIGGPDELGGMGAERLVQRPPHEPERNQRSSRRRRMRSPR